MKRLFPILAIAFVMAFGSVSASTNTIITATTIVNPLQDDTSSSDVESLGFHQELKKRFIEGGPGFMGIVLLCLILGLAIAIERIIFLNLSTTNTKKLTERKGFEPSIRYRIHAFQACALSHSATSLVFA